LIVRAVVSVAADPVVFWLNVGQVNVPVEKFPDVGVPSAGVTNTGLVNVLFVSLCVLEIVGTGTPSTEMMPALTRSIVASVDPISSPIWIVPL
jgi:hypothetical protein